MSEPIAEYLIKINTLIEMARTDVNLQEDMRSGDEQRVMAALSKADITSEDLDHILDDLSLIIPPEPGGFWRFIE